MNGMNDHGLEGGRLPRRAPNVRIVHRSAETLLIGPSGDPHSVNATALALWELCDGATTPREMVNALDTFFDAPRPEIESAVDDMLTELTSRDLVVWVELSETRA